MNILVTGDTGMLGSALVKKLAETKHHVFGLSRSVAQTKHEHFPCDLTDKNNDLDRIFHWTQPDIVVHYAANPAVKCYDSEVSEQNILATHRLLDVCNKNVKFIFASSITVYGDHKQPIDDGSAFNPSSVYAASKLYCEDLIKLYTYKYGILGSYAIMRYVAHIGNNARHGVVYDIMRKLQTDDEYLELIGYSPGSCKPFLHVDDSAKCTIDAFKYKNKTVRVGPNDNISILDMAHTIMDELGIQKPIKWTGNTHDWVGDDKFVQIVPHVKVRTSKEAIVDYVKSNSNRS